MSMRKANRGQPLEISANNWNRLCDLAGSNVSQRPGRAGEVGAEFVYVQNTLGRDLSRFAAVCVGMPTPTQLADGKADQIFQLINGSVAGRYSGYFGGEVVVGVLPEPIAAGRIGRVQISGVTPAAFRSGEAAVVSGTVQADFATISDLDDMLVSAQFGSVRVLHRNISAAASSTDKYWLVLLGTAAPSLGSIRMRGIYQGTNSITWNELYGDRRAMGFYGENGEAGINSFPAPGPLKVCRPGRYHAVVRFRIGTVAPSGGYVAGDRGEWRVTWDTGGIFTTEYGSVTPQAWGSFEVCGEKSFSLLVHDTTSAVSIPLPTTEAKRITFASGATTSLTMDGAGTIEVELIYLGAKAYYTLWTKAARDAAFARGSSAGPI